MARDNAPVRNTCPQIDEAQGMANKAISAMDAATDWLKDLVKACEDLRRENEQLREWGNAEYNRAEEAEGELSDCKGEVEKLEADNDYLNKRIGELENELSL